jgi:Xaa-Pro aminopeptidase
MNVTRQLERLQKAMAASGVDLAVVGPTANLRYVLGFRALAVDRITALLVTPSAAVMLLPDFDVDEFKHETGLEDVVGWSDKRGPAPGVAEAFSRLGFEPRLSSVAVDDEFPFAFLMHLRDRIGACDQMPLSTVLAPLRAVKTEAEIARITRAGALVSAGIDFAIEHARPGITERRLAGQIDAAMRDGGAESVDFVLVASGAGSAAPHHQAGERPLTPGEPVLFDIAVRLDGYFADITQQVFLGEPTPDYARAYEVVGAAQEAGFQAVRAGATAHAVDGAASAVIVEAGLGEWGGPRTGHGIGLDVHEPPSMVEGNHFELVPGNVITVEPGVYIPGRFGIRIEDTVLVGADGPTRLTRGARPLAVRA